MQRTGAQMITSRKNRNPKMAVPVLTGQKVSISINNKQCFGKTFSVISQWLKKQYGAISTTAFPLILSGILIFVLSSLIYRISYESNVILKFFHIEYLLIVLNCVSIFNSLEF